MINKSDCESDSRNEWKNRRYNFDNLGQALMSLFVLSSKDGWVQIMYTGLDAVEIDQQVCMIGFCFWIVLKILCNCFHSDLFYCSLFLGKVEVMIN